MKKIKKFIKRHFKKIATVFCVIISIFVFSISSFADPAIRDTQFDFVQMQLAKNDYHNTVTVRGYNPLTINSLSDDPENSVYTTPNINNRQSAPFLYGPNEKLNIYFSNQNVQRFPNYKTGFMFTEFDIIIAGKSIDYLEVIGYQVQQGFNGRDGNKGTFNGIYVGTWKSLVTFSPDYDFITVSRSNGNYVYANGNKYPSYVFHVSCVVPIRYQYDIVSVSFTLGFKGINNSSYVEYYMTKYNGWEYYSSVNDLPQNIKGIAQEELNDIEEENRLTDELLDGVGDSTNVYKDVFGGLTNGNAINMLQNMEIAGACVAPFMEIPILENILRLALITGVFTLVFSITSQVYDYYDRKRNGNDKPKGTNKKE